MGGTKRERETEDDYYNEGRFQNEACQNMKVRVSFDTTTHFILQKWLVQTKNPTVVFFFRVIFLLLDERKEKREKREDLLMRCDLRRPLRL